MKLSLKQSKSPGRRPPLRTVIEMAEEFGVEVGTLCQALGQDPSAPKHVSQFAGSFIAGKRTYFNLIEMRRWWRSRNKMYHVAVLTPENKIVKAEGGSLALALERFRNEWNAEYHKRHTSAQMHPIPTNVDFEVGEFQRKFNRAEHTWIITTQLTALELFCDTAADEKAARRG